MKLLNIFGIALTLSVTHAYASDYLLVDAYTHHTGPCVHRTKCDQPHWLDWQHMVNDDLSTDIGLGTNSYSRFSAVAGLKYEPLHIGALKFGGFAGLASGYRSDEVPTRPLVAGLSSTLIYHEFTAQVLYVPRMGKRTIGATRLSIGWQI